MIKNGSNSEKRLRQTGNGVGRLIGFADYRDVIVKNSGCSFSNIEFQEAV